MNEKKAEVMKMVVDGEMLEENENIKISEGLVRLIFKEHDEFSVRDWKFEFIQKKDLDFLGLLWTKSLANDRRMYFKIVLRF